jgi:hypothetical protein
MPKPYTPKVVEMPVEDLLLDADNPRLASVLRNGSQDSLVKVLWTEMAVDEIALSIAANGFFRDESLVVAPDKKHRGKFVVLEGNRRLAAVRLLREDELREKVRATDVPKIPEAAKKDLDTLPVSIYPSREAIWQYHGFRHINGPKPWDPYSKAQFIADVHENQRVDLDQIAESIGDRHYTVQRLYRGYVVLRQAERMADFNREDRVRNRFNFNYLYTALDQPDFQRFLGFGAKESLKPDPVPAARTCQLREFMTWLYGSRADSREPLITHQTSDLRMLGAVVSDAQALSTLRTSWSLEKAYEVSIGDKQRFLDAIATAKEALLQANGTVTTGYEDEENLYNLMRDITKIVERIREEMERRRVSAAEKR